MSQESSKALAASALAVRNSSPCLIPGSQLTHSTANPGMVAPTKREESGMQGTWRASSLRSEAEGAGSVRRLLRTGVALLLAALLLVLTTAVALAVTGDLTQAAGIPGWCERDGCGALH